MAEKQAKERKKGSPNRKYRNRSVSQTMQLQMHVCMALDLGTRKCSGWKTLDEQAPSTLNWVRYFANPVSLLKHLRTDKPRSIPQA